MTAERSAARREKQGSQRRVLRAPSAQAIVRNVWRTGVAEARLGETAHAEYQHLSLSLSLSTQVVSDGGGTLVEEQIRRRASTAPSLVGAWHICLQPQDSACTAAVAMRHARLDTLHIACSQPLTGSTLGLWRGAKKNAEQKRRSDRTCPRHSFGAELGQIHPHSGEPPSDRTSDLRLATPPIVGIV